jgi:hypothetical protein
MKLLTITLTAFALFGCNTEEPTKEITAPTVATSLPNSFFTSDRPANVQDLDAVKKEAKKGDDVTFLARIGGRKNASFVPTLSMMIVADPSLKSCELMSEEEHCATPEDYCCENRELLNQGLATVRFLDDEGEAYPFSIDGDQGLETLKYVVIEGTLRDSNDKGLFIVDASKVWVGGKPHYGDLRAGSK